MAAPSEAEMRAIVERHVELWNTGDKEAYIAYIKQAFPGDFTLEDPVGTPIKRGHDILSEMWDTAFNECAWKLSIERLITGGNEVAAVIKNEGEINGELVTLHSIEIYRFGDDGSVHTRAFWDIPAGSEYGEWTTTTGS